jgi:hypothetical protein
LWQIDKIDLIWVNIGSMAYHECNDVQFAVST